MRLLPCHETLELSPGLQRRWLNFTLWPLQGLSSPDFHTHILVWPCLRGAKMGSFSLAFHPVQNELLSGWLWEDLHERAAALLWISTAITIFQKSHVANLACKYKIAVSYPTLIYYASVGTAHYLVDYLYSKVNRALRCRPCWCYIASKASRFFPPPVWVQEWGFCTYCIKLNSFLAVKLL